MFISYNNVASCVHILFLLVFNIFRITFAINLENRPSEILRINQNIGNYTKWLIANGPFHHQPIDKPAVNCLDIAISYSEQMQISIGSMKQQQEQRRVFEEYFTTTLFNGIFEMNKLSIKVRNKFSRFLEKYFCHYFMVIGFNEVQIFQAIQQWSLTRKSKFLIVIYPVDIFNFDRDTLIEIRNPMQWPIHEIFTHSQVILIFNYDIYQLSSPFDKEKRRFIKISEDEFRKWQPHDLHVRDFQGKRLFVSTVHCPPQNYWRDKNTKSGIPDPGTIETMCAEKELNSNENKFGKSQCRKYFKCINLKKFQSHLNC